MAAASAIPERFWKYRTWDEKGYARSMIVDGALYFATVDQLNDPFEFRWRHHLPTAPAERKQLAVELATIHDATADKLKQKAMREILMRDIRNRTRDHPDGLELYEVTCRHGVLCLSEVNSDIVMWSHYSGKHTGVCVGIRRDGIILHQVRPVIYSEELPLIDAFEYVRTSDVGVFTKLSLTRLCLKTSGTH